MSRLEHRDADRARRQMGTVLVLVKRVELATARDLFAPFHPRVLVGVVGETPLSGHRFDLVLRTEPAPLLRAVSTDWEYHCLDIRCHDRTIVVVSPPSLLFEIWLRLKDAEFLDRGAE